MERTFLFVKSPFAIGHRNLKSLAMSAEIPSCNQKIQEGNTK